MATSTRDAQPAPTITSTRAAPPVPAVAPAEDALVGDLYPLRSAKAVSALLRGIKTHPRGTPNRALKITQGLPDEGGRFTYYSSQIETLLSRLEDMSLGAMADALDLDPATVILVPSISQCVLCDGERGALRIYNIVPTKSGWEREVFEPSSPMVVTERGIRTGAEFLKRCPCCNALYNMSYAFAGSAACTKLPAGKELIWSDLTSDDDGEKTRWVQLSRDTVWAASLLRRFTAQSVHSHSGALSFCNEYAQLTSYAGSVESLRRRLMHTHLAWSLVRLHADLCTGDIGPIGFSCDTALDATLLRFAPDLLRGFLKHWGARHKDHCIRPLPGKDWCRAFIFDGHMKCRRLVCENTNARLFDMGAHGRAVLGCTGTPLPNSRFCRKCKASSARRDSSGDGPAPRPDGNVSRTEVSLGVAPDTSPNGADTSPDTLGDAYTCDADDADARLAPGEEDVYLVECIKAHRKLTAANVQKSHKRCLTAGKDQFHLKWQGYPDSQSTWECECRVDTGLVESYREELRSAAAEFGVRVSGMRTCTA